MPSSNFLVCLDPYTGICGKVRKCRYADDTTLNSCDREVKTVIINLEQNDHLKLNEDKCHFLIFGTREEKVSMYDGEVQIDESEDEKFLDITLDKKLTFKNTSKHSVKMLVKYFMHLRVFQSTWSPKKLKLLMKAFVMSQFNYCSLIWMCHDRI